MIGIQGKTIPETSRLGRLISETLEIRLSDRQSPNDDKYISQIDCRKENRFPCVMVH